MDIEEIIRQANKAGKFNQLEGKGKPLGLSKRGPQDMVVGLMKEAGYTPAWAQVGKDLDASADAAKRLKEGWLRRREILLNEAVSCLRKGNSDKARKTLRQMRDEREDVIRDLVKRWTRDRRATEQYNYLVPAAHQQRMLLSPKRLLSAFLEDFPDATLSPESPHEIAFVPADLDIPVLLQEALDAVLAEEGPPRKGMSAQRAEALIGFKEKFRLPKL